MFVREKRISGYAYLYLVETVREDGRAKQRIIKNLGRKEAVIPRPGNENPSQVNRANLRSKPPSPLRFERFRSTRLGITTSGTLERLANSVARYAERAVVLSQIEAGNPAGLACRRIGAPLLFGRLWEETGCRAVVEDLLSGRGFEFAVERAVLPPCCTGSWSPARTGPGRSG